jgi:hypothetical protein
VEDKIMKNEGEILLKSLMFVGGTVILAVNKVKARNSTINKTFHINNST